MRATTKTSLYSIASTLRTQLNWYQYKQLIAIPDHDKREYYELEAVNEGWSDMMEPKTIEFYI